MLPNEMVMLNEEIATLHRRVIGLREVTERLISRDIPSLVFLASPLTSASWNMTAYSSTSGLAPLQLNLSSIFGVPDNVDAVLLHVRVADSGAWGTAWLGFTCGSSYARPDICCTWTFGNDVPGDSLSIVPCDAGGDIWYRILASGVLTCDVLLEVCGYFM